jgi:choline dehydrogenase-like flavoprotein
MREYRESEAVDFVIVGTGAGGGTLAALLAEQGFSAIAFDAGAFFRPLEDFASDETAQNQLYWTDRRVLDGPNPIQMGGKNSGKAVGGSTVHYAMVALRFRPDWFKARTTLGYGADWPISWEEMWSYYGIAERQINVSGPLTYPWGTEAAALPVPRT